MRVTLSYFIEPNPGNRGYTTTYRYPGAQLRFRVSSPNQSDADLEAQVNKLAADDMQKFKGRKYVAGSPNGWTLGQQAHRGSVHSDIWKGSAADLLSMKHIAVFPLAGWWRTRPKQKRANARIKYALIVTLESENEQLDIYTEVANQIAVPVAIVRP